MSTVEEIISEALEEDRREGGHFGAAGFAAFFPEEEEANVLAAWRIYDEMVRGLEVWP